MSGNDYELVIIGGGDHAAVLLDTLFAAGYDGKTAIVDGNRKKWQSRLAGCEILGGDDLLPVLAAEGALGFAVAIGSLTGRPLRAELFERALSCGLTPVNIIHPSAILSQRADISNGVQILAGAIVNTGAAISTNAIINTGAVVEHDCRIGEHVHIAPGACLCGRVAVGRAAFVGARAVIREGLTIGPGAVIGAGAVVVKDVPDGVMVAGNPARRLSTSDDPC